MTPNLAQKACEIIRWCFRPLCCDLTSSYRLPPPHGQTHPATRLWGADFESILAVFGTFTLGPWTQIFHFPGLCGALGLSTTLRAFWCLQLSFFAYSPLRPLLDALPHCKQKALIVSKKAKIVSKKAPIQTAPRRKLPIVSKKAASTQNSLISYKVEGLDHADYHWGQNYYIT